MAGKDLFAMVVKRVVMILTTAKKAPKKRLTISMAFSNQMTFA